MPDFSNFNVGKTARYDEISAIYRIYHCIFNDLDEVYLGDDSEGHFPDVYTGDFQKGFEIVTCENEEFYRNHRGYFATINRDANYRTVFQNWDFVPVKDLNLRKDFIFRTANRYDVDYSAEEKAFYERLRDVTHKKLENLNEGHYDKCKNVNLIIFSGYEKKPYVNIKNVLDIINDENKKFDKQFNFVYVILNDNILQVSKFGEMQNIDDKRDIKRIYQRQKRNNPLEM